MSLTTTNLLLIFVKNNFFQYLFLNILLGYGYLLFTIKVMYSKDVVFTDSEMKAKGKQISIEEVAEAPEIYILGQTADSLAEKLSYTETRRYKGT